MANDEKTNELIRQAVETLKAQAAPKGLDDPKAISAYYAVFDTPATWKPGNRTPKDTSAPAVKVSARFKRSFAS